MLLHVSSKHSSPKCDSGDMILNTDKVLRIDMVLKSRKGVDLYLICFEVSHGKNTFESHETEDSIRNRFADILIKFGTHSEEASEIAKSYKIEDLRKDDDDDKDGNPENFLRMLKKLTS